MQKARIALHASLPIRHFSTIYQELDAYARIDKNVHAAYCNLFTWFSDLIDSKSQQDIFGQVLPICIYDITILLDLASKIKLKLLKNFDRDNVLAMQILQIIIAVTEIRPDVITNLERQKLDHFTAFFQQIIIPLVEQHSGGILARKTPGELNSEANYILNVVNYILTRRSMVEKNGYGSILFSPMDVIRFEKGDADERLQRSVFENTKAIYERSSKPKDLNISELLRDLNKFLIDKKDEISAYAIIMTIFSKIGNAIHTVENIITSVTSLTSQRKDQIETALKRCSSNIDILVNLVDDDRFKQITARAFYAAIEQKTKSQVWLLQKLKKSWAEFLAAEIALCEALEPLDASQQKVPHRKEKIAIEGKLEENEISDKEEASEDEDGEPGVAD